METRRTIIPLIFTVLAAVILASCQSKAGQSVQAAQADSPSTQAVEAPATGADIETPTLNQVEFSLETQIIDGRMVFVGAGGEIDGVVNPDLVVQPGTAVKATLINGDGIPHDLAFPDFQAKSKLVSSVGKSTEISFTVGTDQSGSFYYYCTQPGHRQAGQEGQLIVEGR